MRRVLVGVVMFVALGAPGRMEALQMPAATVLRCAAVCRSTGRACGKVHCAVPVAGVSPRRCKESMRGAAIAVCMRDGRSACPPRRCPF